MKYLKEQIKKYYDYSPAELVDAGICPYCFNKATNGHVYGDESNLEIFDDKDIACLFVANPRADGHMMIATKKHFHDLSECSDRVNKKIICFAKQFMKILCEVFGCERVYLCTMSDGPMNHYHIQLIPRYNFEQRGSKNFVKPRKDYVYDAKKMALVKQKISEYASKLNKSN